MGKVRVVLAGIGGYGGFYISYFQQHQEQEDYEFVGAVDPVGRDARHYPWICEKGIPLYDSLEDFYEVDRADLVIISTPVRFHKEQALCAMAHGSHVLCEKPLTPLLQDTLELGQAAQKYNKLLGVGFQWSFCRPMLELKQDILNGEFGRPLLFKSYTSFRRFDAYYDNSNWKGRIRDAQGNWVLDSIASNATAHYLTHLFFLAGDRMDTSAMPKTACAGIYRAKEIQSFDTCFIKGQFADGCGFYYIATHSGEKEQPNMQELEFEHASVSIRSAGDDARVTAYCRDGRVKEYGDPRSDEALSAKIPAMIEAVRSHASITSTVQSVVPYVTVTNALFDQVPIEQMPQEIIYREEDPSGTFVRGLSEQCMHCFESGMLPSEVGYSWAKQETELALEGYRRFSGKRYE